MKEKIEKQCVCFFQIAIPRENVNQEIKNLFK